MAYLFAHEGKVFAPDHKVEEPPADVDVHNRELSAAEAAAFKLGKSEGSYFAYWHGAEAGQPTLARTITTWMGDVLASVTWVGREYHPPAFGGFRSARINFRAKGIDGRVWAGTFYKSSGQYVRMRPVKARRGEAA